MPKITIDEEACIGCGACTAVAPDLFEMNDSGKAICKKNKNLTKDDLKLAKEAVETCPVQAIKVEE